MPTTDITLIVSNVPVFRRSMFLSGTVVHRYKFTPLSCLMKIMTLVALEFWILGNIDVTCYPRIENEQHLLMYCRGYSTLRRELHAHISNADTCYTN